jgi:multicomponent Na+:H+ antiporter subunit G
VLTFLAIVAATLFSVVGVVGFIRLPDVYTRLHAVGKVSSFGLVLLLIAAVLWTPVSLGKGLLLILMVLISAPVVAHAISSAAYRIGIPFDNYIRNDLDTVHPVLEEDATRVDEPPLPLDIND